MKRIATIAILSITACPQDDAASMSSETGVDPTTTAAPDLPGESSTTHPSTGDGDGDGDPTAGDGDGDATGDGDPGDGDGDDDTGSEAVPASLIVESNGQRIGYLMGVWDYGFIVWDDVNEVSFQLNQQTGHVAGSLGQSGYFATPDCSGQRYEMATSVPIELCNQTGAPSRRYIRGEGALGGGHVAAQNLISTSGDPLIVDVLSVGGVMNCVAFVAQYCMFAIQTTNVIPQTFPLPITVAETLAMP